MAEEIERPRFPSLRPTNPDKGILRKTRSEAPFGAGIQVARRWTSPSSSSCPKTFSGKRDAGRMESSRNGLEETKKIVFCEGYRVMQTHGSGICPLLLPKERSCFWKSPFQLRQAMGPGSSRKEGWMPGRIDMETPRHQSGPTENGRKEILEKLPLLTSGRLESSNTAAGYGPALVTVLPSSANTRRTENVSFQWLRLKRSYNHPLLRKAYARFHDRRSSPPRGSGLETLRKNASLSR